ncbi:MAG TPA: lysozyme [Candidatus Dormibacteraeota bacterium]|nr:lysozyme [Candidatus Dormibacteraeota bacterium]
MASSNILREFLVSIGFNVDQQEFRDFQSKMKGVATQFAELGKIAAAAGVALAATITKTASEMEKLYFSSERTGASIKDLVSLKFAGGLFGIENITGAVENLSAALRSNPGLAMFFQQLGIKQSSSGVQNLINLVTQLQKLGPPGSFGYAIATQIAGSFGVSESQLFMLEKFLPKIKDFITQFQAALRRSGVDIHKLGKDSFQFMVDVGKLVASASILALQFEQDILPVAEEVVHFLQRCVDFAIELNAETKGWSTELGAVAATLLSIVGSLGIARAGVKLLGVCGGVAGGEAAAGGAGAAALGTAAAVGGLAIGDALLLWHDIKEGHKLWQAYGVTNKLRSIGQSASGYISKFEGFSKTAYRDAGHMSIGYGHQIQPGEDFSGGMTQARALQLLAQDTANAQAAVLHLVRTHLNANQLAALTDLVYNIGSTHFANSTLLKDLNAGDFSGAAGQFARFNKVLTPRGYVASADLSARRASERDLFTRQVSLSQKTEINVHGGGDPREAARQVERSQKQVNADLVRDMSGPVQ